MSLCFFPVPVDVFAWMKTKQQEVEVEGRANIVTPHLSDKGSLQLRVLQIRHSWYHPDEVGRWRSPAKALSPVFCWYALYLAISGNLGRRAATLSKMWCQLNPSWHWPKPPGSKATSQLWAADAKSFLVLAWMDLDISYLYLRFVKITIPFHPMIESAPSPSVTACVHNSVESRGSTAVGLSTCECKRQCRSHPSNCPQFESHELLLMDHRLHCLVASLILMVPLHACTLQPRKLRCMVRRGQRSMYQCYFLQAQDSCFKDHMGQFVAVIVAQGCSMVENLRAPEPLHFCAARNCK